MCYRDCRYQNCFCLFFFNKFLPLFLQVKAVREVMNQMIEAWKKVPDLEDASPTPRSLCSSKGIGILFTPIA